MAPKRKGLGKQNFERVTGWVIMKSKTAQIFGNKNLLSFPKAILKSNVNSHMSIQYVNQSESLS